MQNLFFFFSSLSNDILYIFFICSTVVAIRKHWSKCDKFIFCFSYQKSRARFKCLQCRYNVIKYFFVMYTCDVHILHLIPIRWFWILFSSFVSFIFHEKREAIMALCGLSSILTFFLSSRGIIFKASDMDQIRT